MNMVIWNLCSTSLRNDTIELQIFVNNLRILKYNRMQLTRLTLEC